MSCQILKRQTTFWDIRDSSCVVQRWTFIDKEEFGFLTDTIQGFAIVESHPVLIDYHYPWTTVFLSRRVAQPQQVATALEKAVMSQTGPWRPATRYLNGYGAEMVLKAGSGLILDAPTPIADVCIEALMQAGAHTTILSGRDARGPRKALIAGPNFVVARDFHVSSVA